MMSTSNGDVLKERHQAFHSHLLFVVPLGIGYMEPSGTGQFESSAFVWEATYQVSAVTNFPTQSLDDIVGWMQDWCSLEKSKYVGVSPRSCWPLLYTRRTSTHAKYIQMKVSYARLSRQRYRSMIVVSKEISVSLCTFTMISTEVVVSFRVQ